MSFVEDGCRYIRCVEERKRFAKFLSIALVVAVVGAAATTISSKPKRNCINSYPIASNKEEEGEGEGEMLPLIVKANSGDGGRGNIGIGIGIGYINILRGILGGV